mgnify:CR=1 FL=1
MLAQGGHDQPPEKRPTMIYIREFEFYESEGFVLANPCDMEGGTFGKNLEEAVQSAADWLKETIKSDLAHGLIPQGGKLGHEPSHSGRIIAIAIDYDPEQVNTTTAGEAYILGVSAAHQK